MTVRIGGENRGDRGIPGAGGAPDRPADTHGPDGEAFWSVPIDVLAARLGSSDAGLTSEEAQRRLAAAAPGLRRASRAVQALTLLLGQFRNPIVLILLAAAGLSGALGGRVDALIILAIVLASSLLGFAQEWVSADAVARLLALVRVRASVLRDGRVVEIPLEQIVPGDVVELHAGDVVPGDGRLLPGARALFADEAALTGETFPVEKSEGLAPATAPPSRRGNTLFLGTHVVSGMGRMLVARVGRQTEFGRISESLRLRSPETEFERGVRRFGALLLELTLVLTLAIFAVNVLLRRPALESLLFALAIAVGLTPQLLPAIVSVTLAHGARRMAQQRVIVRRLTAIEDLGGMDVLCSDKTGTLTVGRVRLRAAVGADGQSSARVLRLASLNAALQAGYRNPIDEAIRAEGADIGGFTKLDERPYDFVRKRLGVLAAGEGAHRLISKGAVPNVLEVCATARTANGDAVPLAEVRSSVERRFQEYGDQGFRVLAVASRDLGDATELTDAHESDMTFEGLLVFDDPLRPEIAETLDRLARKGVATKIVTGDNRRVAAQVARQAGLPMADAILTGPDLRRMSDAALTRRAGQVGVFAEVEPNQKERIIHALKKSGHAVGYLGDGINDAPALHAADVGISVADAVDVARQAAQIVLLEKDLAVLERGVAEGRRTFANTLKYIFMAASANFGNMISMAGASLFLPYLPMLPKQVLLTNLLTDLPEMTIATDRVDPEMIDCPRRWEIGFIQRFMLVFGAISSVFDFLTFGALLWLLRATPAQLRTGWFVESVVSAALIVLVVRTRRSPLRSRPSRALLRSTLAVVLLTPLLPYTPIAGPLGFAPLPPGFLLALVVIVGLYVASAQAAKRVFYRS
jgi:Mg2+-importing ATPase